MKKFLCSVLCFIKSYFLQALLSVVAFLSFENAYYLGKRTFSEAGTYTKYSLNSFDEDAVRTGTDIAVSTGFDGGSLAMGMICCVCIIMIVWIEINKKPKS